ncbi:hypothetical protein MRX96_058796 [Rhipicephalus microplus]
MEPGAPYLRGTSHVYQSRCQGPLSAPEPRTSLLEAEEATKGLAPSAFNCRNVQVPRFSVLPLSASRCGSFPKREDPLIATTATWPCRLSLGSKQNAWQRPRSPNHDLAPCFVWRIQKPTGAPATITVVTHTPRRAGRSSERAVPPSSTAHLGRRIAVP